MFLRSLTALMLPLAMSVAAHAAAPAQPPGPPRLSVSGADILDPSGKPILLRGWNWGHWGKAQPQDGAENAAQGANVVRIPLRWWGFYKGRGGTVDSREDGATATAGIDPANLRHLDDMVRSASAAKLWIVLFVDSDCGQNGTQDARERQYCDPQGNIVKRPAEDFQAMLVGAVLPKGSGITSTDAAWDVGDGTTQVGTPGGTTPTRKR